MNLKGLFGIFVWLATALAVQGQIWTSQDVGSVGVAGTSTQSASGFTVAGSGADIGGTTDAFRFVYQSLAGDCQVIARVASVPTNNAWSKAGAVIRETLSANAKNSTLVLSRDNGMDFSARNTAGGATTNNVFWLPEQRRC